MLSSWKRPFEALPRAEDKELLPLVHLVSSGEPAQSQYGLPFLFNGRQCDPELGMFFYRNRYLDPLSGRFSTRDRLGAWADPLSLGNPYTYVGNTPWSFTDPAW